MLLFLVTPHIGVRLQRVTIALFSKKEECKQVLISLRSCFDNRVSHM